LEANVKLTVMVRTNKVGSECEAIEEIDEADLPDDAAEREAALNEIAQGIRDNMMEWNWSVTS
jgi:hypothetical protein